MHVLIPMGGVGRRFAEMGYPKPKPFIEVLGKPMIEYVIENIGLKNTFTLCVQREHYNSERELFDRMAEKAAQLNVVLLDGLTRGAAETCLLAKAYIKPDELLFFANCDQIMDWDQQHFESWFEQSKLDGAIFVFDSQSDKNSYVEVDKNGIALRTAEKQVISPHATTGIYIWARGADFVWAAEEMIAKNIRANNEFYVAPCYNENISCGARIGIYAPRHHWPIGTPDDFEYFISKHSEIMK